MLRILIEYILPILLPTGLWVLWLSWRQRRARDAGHPVPGWDTVPWSWLLVAGGALAMLLLIGGVLVGSYSTGTYHPAQVDAKGQLVPGRVD
ncbi:MAG TPA: hypothetical protein VK558_08480 [Patescibacteria group bacterium]|nr:hypothetical protein [Patescibacteria group bacterium]